MTPDRRMTLKQAADDHALTIGEAAEVLRVSRRWLEYWLAAHPVDAVGSPFYVPMGRRKTFERNDIAVVTLAPPSRNDETNRRMTLINRESESPMQPYYRKDQPERFANAVKACCGLTCSYPNCTPLCIRPFEVEKAINAWETLPLPNGER